MKFSRVLIAGTVLLAAACTNMTPEQQGTVTGGLLGAGAGAGFAAITGGDAGVGAALGGVAGAVAGNMKGANEQRRGYY